MTFRHPAVYYKMGVTLDEISAGRFTMGIGTGWLDEEFTLFGLPYPDRGTRFEMLDECLAYLSSRSLPGRWRASTASTTNCLPSTLSLVPEI